MSGHARAGPWQGGGIIADYFPTQGRLLEHQQEVTVGVAPADFPPLQVIMPRDGRESLVRYHGILAPNAREGSLITPAGRRAATRVPQSPHSPPPSPARG